MLLRKRDASLVGRDFPQSTGQLDYRDAAAAFSKAVAIKPNAAFGHYGLALVESSQGHYAASLTHLQQLAIATVINLVRILAWSESQPIAKTRTSRFAALVVY